VALVKSNRMSTLVLTCSKGSTQPPLMPLNQAGTSLYLPFTPLQTRAMWNAVCFWLSLKVSMISIAFSTPYHLYLPNLLHWKLQPQHQSYHSTIAARISHCHHQPTPRNCCCCSCCWYSYGPTRDSHSSTAAAKGVLQSYSSTITGTAIILQSQVH
jgi:hypothetical protein